MLATVTPNLAANTAGTVSRDDAENTAVVRVRRLDGSYVDLTVTTRALGTPAVRYYGNEVPNWLRDENRKALLFGSLYHIFDYLDDSEQAGVYREKFAIAIGELNDEEKRRDLSGANVSINYTSYLL